MSKTIPAPNDFGNQRITLRMIRHWAQSGQCFAMLTCYDATTARWLADGGIPTLLVGDSAAQVILGYEQSIFAPLDFLITLTAAVRRGAPQAFVLGDMPFLSYQADEAQAILNAGRFMVEGFADAVKLEVDGSFAPLVGKMTRAGIPVVAHLGWRPQRARYEGIKSALVAGRTESAVEAIVDQARMMEDQGAVMLLLEQTTARVAERVVSEVSIPVIGCGAGPACHGHVVVLQDLLGYTLQHPSFVKPLAQLGPAVAAAAKDWVRLVASGEYLKKDHPYRMDPENKG